MKIINYLFLVSIISFGITGCYYDNEEELYPQAVACDTSNITYAQSIVPIMAQSCNGCHGGSAPSANVITDTYEGLKQIADDGRLWGTVNHENGYSPMPKDLPKLNDCDLTRISIWLNNGALED
jgi:hypothetical protein